MNGRKTTLFVEQLENRNLLSGGPWGGGFPGLNPAVQADLAKIQADEKMLVSDLKTLAPTLAADQKALQQAIQAAIQNDPAVQAAITMLHMDSQTWQATIKGDIKALLTATSASARQGDITQLKADLASAAAAFKTDSAAVRAAINNDAGVQAAQMQLTNDSAPITADEAALKADFAQLQSDLHSSPSPASGPIGLWA